MKIIYILLLVFVSLSCRENIVEYEKKFTTGNLYITSTPPGAEIYFENQKTGKTTPDSMVNIQAGNYLVRLRLLGVGDESVYTSILAGRKNYLDITFTRNF